MTLSNVFVETRFPEDISYNSQGGPSFSTTIFTSSSGREQRNINWSKARSQYDVAHAIKKRDDMDVVLAFFYAMMGKAYAFRYKDWADFQIFNQNIGYGDGVKTAFQFIKTYSDPNNIQFFYRVLKKPVVGTLGTVTIDNVPTTAYDMDYTTGIMTLHAPLPDTKALAVIYCEFDVPVRFDTDVSSIKQDFFMIESWESIKLVEVKL